MNASQPIVIDNVSGGYVCLSLGVDFLINFIIPVNINLRVYRRDQALSRQALQEMSSQRSTFPTSKSGVVALCL